MRVVYILAAALGALGTTYLLPSTAPGGQGETADLLPLSREMYELASALLPRDPPRPRGLPQNRWAPCAPYAGATRTVATLVVEPRRWSMAVVREAADAPTKVVGLGYRIGAHQLVDIQRGRLVFAIRLKNKEGGAEGTQIRYECTGTNQPTADTSAPANKAKALADPTDWRRQITKVSTHHYRTTVAAIDALKQPNISLRRSGRIEPHRDAAGQVDGIRVAKLTKGSIWEHIGIKSGDVVRAVDGEPLRSLNMIMTLLDRPVAPGIVRLEILRRGQPFEMIYEID